MNGTTCGLLVEDLDLEDDHAHLGLLVESVDDEQIGADGRFLARFGERCELDLGRCHPGAGRGQRQAVPKQTDNEDDCFLFSCESSHIYHLYERSHTTRPAYNR